MVTYMPVLMSERSIQQLPYARTHAHTQTHSKVHSNFTWC